MYILTILNQTHQFTARKPKFLKPLMINLNNMLWAFSNPLLRELYGMKKHYIVPFILKISVKKFHKWPA